MELTNVAVYDRIADLNHLADELRLERTLRGREVRVRASRGNPAQPIRWIGAWLIGIGTALGGAPADRRAATR